MVNGRLGDHPLTDMLVHGKHPFPKDMEKMLREILEFDPIFPDGKRYYVDQVRWDQRFWEWAKGKNLDEGRCEMQNILKDLRKNKQ